MTEISRRGYGKPLGPSQLSLEENTNPASPLLWRVRYTSTEMTRVQSAQLKVEQLRIKQIKCLPPSQNKDGFNRRLVTSLEGGRVGRISVFPAPPGISSQTSTLVKEPWPLDGHQPEVPPASPPQHSVLWDHAHWVTFCQWFSFLWSIA